ncbi:MAG: hypothetical protein VXV76_03415 [Candidatus Thermoplasmatota archaeon]|nr:hypothetical protein [Candidatus Thermoplasmatota archaeon]MEC8313082.1 hypothetical protein [Candidatus Thermoplasmatota archaeon]
MTLAMLAKHTISTIFAVFLINVGIAHFTDTQWFEPIVPDALGDPTLWVLLTGVLEIVLGIGIIIPQTRKYACILLVAFLVAVYWANLNMWVNDIPLDNQTFANFWHILRLIAQLVMILIALWVGDWLPSRAKYQSIE